MNFCKYCSATKMLNDRYFSGSSGEWGEMAMGQNAQIDFLCNSIALAF